MIRKPAVKGTFYPANRIELEKFIKESTPPECRQSNIKGALLPHAGYIYSGKTAVEAVAHITPKDIVLIMGPNHTGKGKPFSVCTKDNWQMPSGQARLDSSTAHSLVEKSSYLEDDSQAHTFEHSVEVQLPIFQHFFKDFKFIPVVCTQAGLETYKQIANDIYTTLKESGLLEKILIVTSSDMTHYEPKQQAMTKDKYVLEALLHLNSEEFLKRISENHVTMCGTAPAAIMIEILKLMGIKNSKLVKYTTSGETNKDYSSVVGYAGAIFG